MRDQSAALPHSVCGVVGDGRTPVGVAPAAARGGAAGARQGARAGGAAATYWVVFLCQGG